MTTGTTAKATPGPWHTSQRTGDETSVRSLDGSIVAECNTLADRGQELANARLITAAPAMLAALKEMQARYFIKFGNDDLYDKATAAIADAT